MAEEPPRGDAPPASGDADARTRVSQVSLGSSIPEDISADISEVPLDATRDSTEGGLLDASALAPASLDVTRESTGSGAAFDAGYFDDAGTATPLFASPRVQYDPHRGVPADTAKHGRRAGVPLPPAAAAAPTADGFRPPLSPPAATPSSARAHALASSYSAPKPPGPSMSEKRGTAALASSSQKTPAAATSGNADAPQEARSVGLPPTPAGAFVTPAHAPGGEPSRAAPARETRDSRESPLGSGGFDSDEELSPSSCASVPEPTARAPRARPERGDPARSSATPPAPREKAPTPSPAPTAEPDVAAAADRAAAAPSEDEDEDKDEDEEVLTAEEARSSSEDAGTVPADDLTDEHRSESIGQPWQLEPVSVAGTTLLLDPETRQTFLPPAQSSRDGRMPTFCGRVAVDGTFAPHRPLCDFFDAAKRFCQTRRVSVAELFRLYDDAAKLPPARFAKLVRECLSPAVSAAELAYTHAMLDLDGRGEVTPADVEACVREMADPSGSFGNDDEGILAGTTEPTESPRAETVKRFAFCPDCAPRATAPSPASFLERVADTAVTKHGGSLAGLFHACVPKTSWTGTQGLDALGVLALVQKAFPGMIRADARVVLAEFRALDLDNDGLVSLQELRRGVRLATTARVVPGEGFGKPLDGARGRFPVGSGSGAVSKGTKPKKAKKKTKNTSTKEAEVAKKNARTNPNPSRAFRENGANGANPKRVTVTVSKTDARPDAKTRVNPKTDASLDATPSPMKKREELALRKRLRAARVRADKKVARGELVESDVRGEIAKVEETLRAAAYERKLAARRAALAAASSEAHLDARTRAFREAQLVAFDAARARDEEDERLRRRDAARRDAALFSSEPFENSLEVSEALLVKWREEEAYAMVETYGKEEVLTALAELAASKDDATGAFRADEVARVSAALAEMLSAEDETRALELVARAKEQTRSRREAAEAKAEADAEAKAKADAFAKERARAAFQKEERERRYGDEYDADLQLERLRHDRISSEWTGGVEATPEPPPRVPGRQSPSAIESESGIGVEDWTHGTDDDADDRTTERQNGADSVFPSLFAGYPASPATIGRSPRRFVVDGEPRFAVEDRSHEKPMFLPPRNAPAER